VQIVVDSAGGETASYFVLLSTAIDLWKATGDVEDN
jgi:hypothetical protein